VGVAVSGELSSLVAGELFFEGISFEGISD
jgi:hypothetical protein